MQYTETIQKIDLLELHKQFPARYPHVLQSCNAIHSNNQYDILFAKPRTSVELWHDGLRLVNAEDLHDTVDVKKDDNFLDCFQNWFASERHERKSDLPFSGGWFAYLSYEFAQSVEQHALNLFVLKDVPIAFFTRFEEAIIYNRTSKETILFSEKNDQQAIEQVKADIQSVSDVNTDASGDQNQPLGLLDIKEDESLAYIEGVNKIKRYIKEGDIFQVNLSRQWNIRLKEAYQPLLIYKKLRKANPAPFSGLMTHQNFAIVSSSPERLVSTHRGQVETRPIAGTRPRDKDKSKDQALIDELTVHPKEKAEHIMLIDLERNDLGRICKPGTIDVNELMVVESFEHVHHLVSNVIGQLREGVTPDQVIKAVFPGGTITGCPKVRCMQILRELEQTPRSSYTGSMGYINSNGDMDLNILIRGIQLQGDKLAIRAGAGIVADSIAHKEVAETRSKAKGMLAALGIDVKKPQGLLETFRVTSKQSIPLWQYHKARLIKGLHSYGVDESHVYLIEKQVFEHLSKPGVYRLAVQIVQGSVLNIVVSEREDINAKDKPAWRLVVCETRLADNVNSSSVKLLERDAYQMASTEITAAKTDDGFLLNRHGNIIETTICNIFAIKDNVLYTPDVMGYGVDGVMKNTIKAFCERTGIECVETDITLDFLLACEHVFLCNAVRGILNVSKINEHKFVVGHSIIKQLLGHIEKLFYD